ncbi:MAG: DPP IV N-terminal domain-containing protein [Bacteroidales bacterium]
MKKFFLIALAAILSSAVLVGQNIPIIKADYELPARFSPKKLENMVFSTTVKPHWLKNSTKFWYSYETTSGKTYYIVDPALRSRKVLFDNADMAAQLSHLTKEPFDARHLPIQRIKFIKNETTIQFEVKSTLVDEDKKDDEENDMKQKKDKKASSKPDKKTYYFEYNVGTGKVVLLDDYKKPKENPDWANIAPNGEIVVFSKKYNLYWMDKANYEKALKNEDDSTIVEHQLTTDGEKDYSYGFSRKEEDNVDEVKNMDKRKSAFVTWSHDSKYFAMTRTDQRNVKDLWVIKTLSAPRPTLETYKYQMPGEKEAPQDELLIFNLEKDTVIKPDISAFKDQDIMILNAHVKASDRDDDYVPIQWISKYNDRVYFVRTSRDLKRVDVCYADPKTAKVTPVIEERLNTYIDFNGITLANNEKEIIFWSERDGWGHFYLYDNNGKLIRQITSGTFHCDNVEGVDEPNRVLYFVACGREPNENPYYMHHYRINLDGSGLKLLNRGNYDHAVSMDDNTKFFVDNFSRVNTTPESKLMDNQGTEIMLLEKADLGLLFQAGYKFPEPFTIKAADGITDLYGVMYKPFNFDSTKLYPLIEYVYPGPQTEAVNSSFSTRMDRIDRLAQFGFIVITVGNRGGNPARSKWYHSYGYGNLRNYGLADKKAVAEQLAYQHKYIDINRVGIHGHSGGGFMTAAAMLTFPDFFKVGVSNAGNHENNIYNRWWSEKHHGVKEIADTSGNVSFEYSIDKNSEIAKNLKGHLLLTFGEADNNVHPGNTIRLANALIKANKRFDIFIFPGQRHGYGDMTEYYFWLMGDYFCRYLLGNFPDEVDMPQMNNEAEKR